MENAYAQLEAEGYLCARERRGYFVSPVEARAPAGALRSRSRNRPGPGGCWIWKGAEGGTEGFPFSVWARLTRRVLTQRGEQLLRPCPPTERRS